MESLTKLILPHVIFLYLKEIQKKRKTRRQQIISPLDNSQQDTVKLCFWSSLPEDKNACQTFQKFSDKNVENQKVVGISVRAFLDMFSI